MKALKSRQSLEAFSIGCAAFLLFLPTVLQGELFFDDRIHLLNNLRLRDAGGWKTLLTEPAFPGSLYRPVTFLSFWIEQQLFGIEAWHVHLINVFLHSCNAVLVYFLIRAVGQEKLALGVAGLFAVHPIHTEVLASGVGRAEIFALFFGLLGCLGAVIGKTKLAVVYFLLAAFSKESGVLFPLLAMLCLYHRKKPVLVFGGVSFGITLSAVLLARFFVIGSLTSTQSIDFVDNPIADLPQLDRAGNALFLFGRYLLLCVVPFPLSADYSFATLAPQLLSSVSPFFLVLASSILLLALMAFLSFRQHSLLGFGLLWFFTAFLLTANVFLPIGTIFADRLTYTPSIGICLFLAAYCFRFDTRFVQRGLLVFAVLAFSAISLRYQAVWRSEESLVHRQVTLFPNSVKMLVNYSVLLRGKGNLREAEQALLRANAIYPRSADVMFSLAVLRTEQGKLLEAKQALSRTLQLQPAHVEAINVLSRIFIREGELAKAEQFLREGLKITSQHEKLLSALYVLEIATADLDSAQKIGAQLEALGSRDPDYLRARALFREILRGNVRSGSSSKKNIPQLPGESL